MDRQGSAHRLARGEHRARVEAQVWLGRALLGLSVAATQWACSRSDTVLDPDGSALPELHDLWAGMLLRGAVVFAFVASTVLLLALRWPEQSLPRVRIAAGALSLVALLIGVLIYGLDASRVAGTLDPRAPGAAHSSR